MVDRAGFLADIVEKPDHSPDNDFGPDELISMNCWRFGSGIFQSCREVPQSLRGEYELPEAVKLAIQKGSKFKVAICREGVLDMSRRSDIGEIATRLRNVEVRL